MRAALLSLALVVSDVAFAKDEPVFEPGAALEHALAHVIKPVAAS